MIHRSARPILTVPNQYTRNWFLKEGYITIEMRPWSFGSCPGSSSYPPAEPPVAPDWGRTSQHKEASRMPEEIPPRNTRAGNVLAWVAIVLIVAGLV